MRQSLAIAHLSNQMQKMSDSPIIVRIEQSHGSNAQTSRKSLGAAENEKLACSLYEVPPGYVLEGSGTRRLAEEDVAIASRDYIAFPCRESCAHQIVKFYY
jgi:hypothetical protein